MNSIVRQEGPDGAGALKQVRGRAGVSPRRRRSQRGAEVLEATITFVLFFAFLFLVIDLSLAVHAQGTLQQAVQLAARDSSVGLLSDVDASGNPITCTSLAARVAAKVAKNSYGLMSASQAACKLTITFWDQDASPASNVTTLVLGHKTILTVKLRDYTYSPVGPIGHAPDKLHISAVAASVMDCPFSGCPTAFDTPWPPASCN